MKKIVAIGQKESTLLQKLDFALADLLSPDVDLQLKAGASLAYLTEKTTTRELILRTPATIIALTDLFISLAQNIEPTEESTPQKKNNQYNITRALTWLAQNQDTHPHIIPAIPTLITLASSLTSQTSSTQQEDLILKYTIETLAILAQNQNTHTHLIPAIPTLITLASSLTSQTSRTQQENLILQNTTILLANLAQNHDTHTQLIPAIPALTKLVTSLSETYSQLSLEEKNTLAYAIFALANLTKNQTARNIMISNGFIPALTSLLVPIDNNKIQKIATFTLLRLAEKHDTRTQLIPAIPALTRLVTSLSETYSQLSLEEKNTLAYATALKTLLENSDS